MPISGRAPTTIILDDLDLRTVTHDDIPYAMSTVDLGAIEAAIARHDNPHNAMSHLGNTDGTCPLPPGTEILVIKGVTKTGLVQHFIETVASDIDWTERVDYRLPDDREWLDNQGLNPGVDVHHQLIDVRYKDDTVCEAVLPSTGLGLHRCANGWQFFDACTAIKAWRPHRVPEDTLDFTARGHAKPPAPGTRVRYAATHSMEWKTGVVGRDIHPERFGDDIKLCRVIEGDALAKIDLSTCTLTELLAACAREGHLSTLLPSLCDVLFVDHLSLSRRTTATIHTALNYHALSGFDDPALAAWADATVLRVETDPLRQRFSPQLHEDSPAYNHREILRRMQIAWPQ